MCVSLSDCDSKSHSETTEERSEVTHGYTVESTQNRSLKTNSHLVTFHPQWHVCLNLCRYATVMWAATTGLWVLLEIVQLFLLLSLPG